MNSLSLEPHDAPQVRSVTTPEGRSPGDGAAELRCVVLLTTGRSGSTFLTRAWSRAWGLHLGEVSRYAENVAVWHANRPPGAVWEPAAVSPEAARAALAALPRPWLVKDPAFAATLSAPAWTEAFAPYRPELWWLTRDLGATQASLDRVGWAMIPGRAVTAERLHAMAAERFAEWTGPKRVVRAEDVAEAYRDFDPDRLTGAPR